MPPAITPDNIHPLTAFKRNSHQFVERMKSSGEPVVLTVNGKAEVVVQNAQAYQLLLEAADQNEAIRGIQKGLLAIERGRHQSAKKAFAQIRRKRKIPQPAR